MAKSTKSPPGGGEDITNGGTKISAAFPLERELVAIVKPEVGLQAAPEGVASANKADVAPLSKLLAKEKISMQPLFGLSEERMRERTASLAAETGEEFVDLSNFYHVDAPENPGLMGSSGSASLQPDYSAIGKLPPDPLYGSKTEVP